MSVQGDNRAKGNLITCYDVINGEGQTPPTLRELDITRILGREVLDWSPVQGTYGMGGPGFFGLELAPAGDYPQEWLVLRLWGADNWLLLDGQWLGAHPNQYHIQEPLFSDFGGDESWDRVAERLVGATISEAQIERDKSVLVLANGAKRHTLEIPDDPSLLPKYGGTWEPHVWNPDDDHRDAWIIVHGELWI